jgi:hypothetical protein
MYAKNNHNLDSQSKSPMFLHSCRKVSQIANVCFCRKMAQIGQNSDHNSYLSSWLAFFPDRDAKKDSELGQKTENTKTGHGKELHGSNEAENGS